MSGRPFEPLTAVGTFHRFACILGNARKPEKVTRKLCRPRFFNYGNAEPLHENDFTPSSAQAGQECPCKKRERSLTLSNLSVLRKFVIKCLEKIGCFVCVVCLHGSCIATTWIFTNVLVSHQKILSNHITSVASTTPPTKVTPAENVMTCLGKYIILVVWFFAWHVDRY